MKQEKTMLNKKYSTYPMVIDWLQWSDEFNERLDKPDMPQLTLSLISEMRSDLKQLESKLEKLKDALLKLSNSVSATMYAHGTAIEMDYGRTNLACLQDRLDTARSLLREIENE